MRADKHAVSAQSGIEEPVNSATIQDKIAFARHLFENYQALIRSVDTKAGALLGLALFFAASVFPISKDAVSHLSLKISALGLASVLFLVSGLSFVVFFLVLIGALGRVIKPRGARFYSDSACQSNLVWQEHIGNFCDNGSYFEAVSAVKPMRILRNLTDQVFELAHISKEKMAAVNAGFVFLRCLAFSWVSNVVLGLILLGWKQ